jgi:hypothetical protein
MKTPRVKDFDPDAKVPSLKSSMENMPTIGKPTHTPPPVETPEDDRLFEQITQQQAKLDLPERANASTGKRPSGKRIITRNSFEIYEDQMDALRKLSFQEKMDGKLGSMSNMVREAIDNYLLRRNLRK